MSTVLGVVGDHDGGITVETTAGGGSTFTVYFPATQRASDVTGDTGRTFAAPHQLHILLVEDEDAVLEVGKRILESLGYSVSIALDGQQAIATYEANPDDVDCVVLDFMMPVQDGRETFYQLRRINRDLPIVLVSGLSESPELANLADERRLKIIGKPFVANELRDAISEVRDD